MSESRAVEPEIEGGGSTWWYVCGECRGPVSPREKECRRCRTRLDWSFLRLMERRIYTGEQTEPAE